MKAFLLSFVLSSSAFAAAASDTLTDESYGLVKFGAKLSAVEKKVGEKMTFSPTSEQSCRQGKLKKYPDMYFMVENGIVTRADVDGEKNVPNAYGVKLGDPMEEFKTKHPEIKIKPHTYIDGGFYLFLHSKDGRRAIVIEETEGKASAIRGGMLPSVGYVEGCS